MRPWFNGRACLKAASRRGRRSHRGRSHRGRSYMGQAGTVLRLCLGLGVWELRPRSDGALVQGLSLFEGRIAPRAALPQGVIYMG